eukprot:6474073-Amphidinium_carterae.2
MSCSANLQVKKQSCQLIYCCNCGTCHGDNDDDDDDDDDDDAAAAADSLMVRCRPSEATAAQSLAS